jgi:hypothetical protein
MHYCCSHWNMFLWERNSLSLCSMLFLFRSIHVYASFICIFSLVGHMPLVWNRTGECKRISINTLRTGCLIWGAWLLNVADRSPHMRHLGHVRLKHTILCTGDIMAHTFAYYRSRMFCLAVSKHALTVFLAHSKRKCLCRNEALLLFLVSGVRGRV